MAPPLAEPASGAPRRAAALVATALGAAGIGYRLVALTAGLPPTDSDEATMGLAALHIATGRDLPIYFYGQHYMGTLEAYLAAPLFAAAGPSLAALRAPNLLLYAVFLVVMWQLTRRLYTPWFATLTTGLLALGSDRVLKDELLARGGYPEIALAGAALLLLAVTLTDRPRLTGYAAFGALTGLMLWDDWLVLPYVAAAFGVLLHAGPGVLRGRPGWVLGGCALLGAAPLLLHDLTTPLRHSSVVTFLGLNGGRDAAWLDRLHGAAAVGVALGGGMCSPGRCEPWQLWWSAAWPLLAAAACWLAVRALRTVPGPRDRARPAGAYGGAQAVGTCGAAQAAGAYGQVWQVEGQERVRQVARLAMVAAAGVSLLSYARSPAAGLTPVESARYLHCLLISMPALLWPLWVLAGSGMAVLRVTGVALLAAVVATMVAATVALVQQRAAVAAVDDRQARLVAELDRLGVTRLYSEYWTCNHITFLAGERIRCAVIGVTLRHGLDRYLPYRAEVAAAPQQTFVLTAGSSMSHRVAGRLTASGTPFTVRTAAGYDIYQPARRVDLPLARLESP